MSRTDEYVPVAGDTVWLSRGQRHTGGARKGELLVIGSPTGPGRSVLGDLHRARAAEIFAVPPDAVTDEQRRYAKTINYAELYVSRDSFGTVVEAGASSGTVTVATMAPPAAPDATPKGSRLLRGLMGRI